MRLSYIGSNFYFEYEMVILYPDDYLKMVNMSKKERGDCWRNDDNLSCYIFYRHLMRKTLIDDDAHRIPFRYDRYKKRCLEEQVKKMRKLAEERMAILNQNNIIHETYIRKMMHPSKIASPLLENPALNVSEYMDAYVAAL